MSKKYPNLIEAGLKVGDTVDGIWGEMIVISITNGPTFPIKAKTEFFSIAFTEHGYVNIDNVYPSIWFKSDTDWFNPPMSPPEPDHVKEFYTDRPVWARNHDFERWFPEYAAIYTPNANSRFVVFHSEKKQFNTTGVTEYRQVSYTKPEGAEDHENA